MPGPIRKAAIKATRTKAAIERLTNKPARPAHNRAPAEQASHFGAQCCTLGPFLGSAAVESGRGYMTGMYVA